MTLTTPILYSVSAFDASQTTTFTFSVLGGSQVVKNTLTIKDNATLAIVYSETQTTFQFKHTVPAGTLTNGAYYQATLTTQDADGNVSNVSNAIQFYCYATPSFSIVNMPSGNVVTNVSYAFQVTYNQGQGEILNAYVFNLYSVSGALISTSGTLYNTSTKLPFTASYLFSGFEDRATYSIEVNGVTAEGTQITTGKVQFTTNYTTPDTFSFLSLTNNCKGGYIAIESNVVGIDGETNPEEPIYINNDEIDLRANGTYVQWVDGYIAPINYTARLWGRRFTPNTEIFRFSNINGDIVTITYRTDNAQCWLEMKVLNNGDLWGYVIESEYIALPDADEQIFCWLRNNDNLYELKIENRGVRD